MAYERTASQHHPAYVVMLIDVSESMKRADSGRMRIDMAMDAALAALDGMIDLSRDSHGDTPAILPRFQVGVYGYHQWVIPLHHSKEQGFVPITELQDLQPWAQPGGQTNGAKAFHFVFELLRDYRPQMEGCPAPLVIHLTDAEFGEDIGALDEIERTIEAIRGLGVEDGAPLIEHVYVGGTPLCDEIAALSTWPGIQDASQLRSELAQLLFRTASPTPPSYRRQLIAKGMSAFSANARLLFPGHQPDLVRAAFALSGTTGFLKR